MEEGKVETEVRTILHELIEKVVSLHSQKPGNQVFDELGRYKFMLAPPKQNFKFTH